jgi:anti-anti-sigma factor
MSTPLALNTSRSDDGTLVLSAAGELDLSNVKTFAQALTDAINAAASAEVVVTVDLSRIEYLDSSAINVLFTHARQIRGLIINQLLNSVITYSGLSDLVAVEARLVPEPPSEEQR